MTKLPETTRIARILELVWLVSRDPRRWTRKALAERFEISERMITADLELIRHGLKFEINNVRGQGYYFTSLPSLPAVSYSLPEALALILAAQSARQLSGISQTDLAAAIAPSPIRMPGRITASMPIQTSLPTTVSPRSSRAQVDWSNPCSQPWPKMLKG